MKKDNKAPTNVILLILLLAVIGVTIYLAGESEFAGADGQAASLITEINPGYQPWYSSWLEPSKEMESLLFALQAALGAGFLGYYIGYKKGKAKKEED